MSDQITVKKREIRGSRSCRKMRYEGQVPAVLYGHGEESLSLAVSLDEIRKVLRHGGKIVQLDGAASGQALVQDLQWDTFGRVLLHLDLLRVKAGEMLSVEIPLETKGDAPGENEGGIVEVMMHTIEIECPPAAMPEKLHVDISGLELHGSITAAEIIDLPEKAKLSTDPEAVVVHCVPPVEEPDAEEAVADTGAEPEVVGKADDEDDGEGDSDKEES